MKTFNKTLVSLLAASSLLACGGAFAGGHWHQHGGGGHHWHGGGHWHHWHGGWRWHPFWGPRVAVGVAAAAVTTAAIASAASQPHVVYHDRVVYRDAPTRVRTCHVDNGYRYCKTVTYN